MLAGKFISRTPDANLTAVSEGVPLTVSDLSNVTCHVVERVADGTVGAQVEYSHDGIVWIPVGAVVAAGDFPAVVNAAVERPLEAPNGMSIVALQVRLRLATHTGTGEYDLVIGGRKASV